MRGVLQAACGALAALCLWAAGPAGAQGFGQANTGTGARALEGRVFALQSGETVRLAGLGAPADGPEAEAAQNALEELIAGRRISMTFDEEREDRRGRLIAHVYSAEEGDPVWVQEQMLLEGRAWVETTPQTASMAAIMLPLEAEARAAGRGLWADPDRAVMEPDPHALAQRLDTFQIVEGIVVSTAETEDFVYLNFGLDYRTDFTASIAQRDLARVEDGGLDPLALEGARIRVRGYVHAVNGPMIDVTHAAQIEVLD